MTLKPTLTLAKLLLFILVTSISVEAKVHVPAIIGDNMVLQQDMKVRIWGEASPNERITVKFNSTSANAVADSQGHWQTMIGPYKPGGPYELTISGENTLVFKNVLVGEVWVCS